MVGRLAVSYMVNQVRRSEIPWDHLLRPDWIMGESDPYPRSSMQWPRSSDNSQADSLTSPTTFAIHVAYFEGSFPASAPSAGLSASAAASKNRGTDLCSAIDCKASTSLSQQDSGTMVVCSLEIGFTTLSKFWSWCCCKPSCIEHPCHRTGVLDVYYISIFKLSGSILEVRWG